MKLRTLKSLLLIVVLSTLCLSACNQATPEVIPTATPLAVETTAPDAVETTVPETPEVEDNPQNLILATTTSTYDSGLLDYIVSDFEEQHNIKVDIIAVGTGQALQLGMDGNADVLLVHARSREDAFMEEDHGVRREDVMYNDFVIVGPASDPAGIQGQDQVQKAMEMIAAAEAAFVSRGDDSGTHTKEKGLWSAAGIEPAGGWYISAGQGMGAVITMADEQQAYTLSDRATYLARTLEGTALEIMVEGDAVLFNPYGVIAVNPAKNDAIHHEQANMFIDWLISMPTQEKIAEFGIDKFGAPLFTPDSAEWRAAHDTPENAAAFQISGKVGAPQAWAAEEIEAMEAMEIEITKDDGETKAYNGVAINALLTLAAPEASATTLVLIADDGYSVEVSLEEIQACEECILAIDSEGSYRSAFPGFPKNTMVKGLIEIQVQ